MSDCETAKHNSNEIEGAPLLGGYRGRRWVRWQLLITAAVTPVARYYNEYLSTRSSPISSTPPGSILSIKFSNKDFASSFWPVLLLSNLSWKRNCSKFEKSNKERPQCWPDIHHDRQSWRLLKLQANWYIQQRTDCESYNLSAALL